MDKFWVVTLFHFQPSIELWHQIQKTAVDEFDVLGVEEFSLDEAQVDAILGERSYSGGDLPLEVLDEVEAKVLSKPASYRLFFSEEGRATSFMAFLKGKALTEIQIEECDSEDWNAEWKKHYAPIRVNGRLDVVPSWMKGEASTAENQILIYPGMGFGTGSHETTFLCLKLFTEEIVGQEVESVLDFGSGSGILGLSSFKFYPEARVDFYDIDIEANKNCYQNAEINELTEKAFRLLLPEVRDHLKTSYDLVFANILESILMLEKNNLISSTASSGSLILSGLLNHQVDAVVEAYSKAGMDLVKRLDKGDWSALLMKKKP